MGCSKLFHPAIPASPSLPPVVLSATNSLIPHPVR
uniref:Uncharacterized protein n=1 Tax=Anopheles atroparvus TaxID=41427 RepID=A0AAG5CSE6_ANOAO